MATIVMWVGIGVLALFLLIGMIAGLIRGLKRSSLHILFLIGSVVLAFFITKDMINLLYIVYLYVYLFIPILWLGELLQD